MHSNHLEGLLKHRLSGPTPRFWCGRLYRPSNLHFLQVLWGCWCCQYGDHIWKFLSQGTPDISSCDLIMIKAVVLSSGCTVESPEEILLTHKTHSEVVKSEYLHLGPGTAIFKRVPRKTAMWMALLGAMRGTVYTLETSLGSRSCSQHKWKFMARLCWAKWTEFTRLSLLWLEVKFLWMLLFIPSGHSNTVAYSQVCLQANVCLTLSWF